MATATATTLRRPQPKIGQYLEDGIRLYRVEILLPNREGVVLEDCHSMKLIALTFQQFRQAKLSNV